MFGVAAAFCSSSVMFLYVRFSSAFVLVCSFCSHKNQARIGFSSLIRVCVFFVVTRVKTTPSHDQDRGSATQWQFWKCFFLSLIRGLDFFCI